MAFSAVCFGAIPIAVTIAQRNGLPLVATLAWRYGLGAALLLLLAGGARRTIVQQAGLVPFAVLGAMQALVAAVSLSALAFIDAATLSFLFFTFPAWVAVIAAVRRTEPLTPARIAALALALAGIAVMVGAPAGGVHPLGVGLALTSAILYAIYIPVIGHFAARHGGYAASSYAAAGAGAVFILAGLLAPGLTAGLTLPATVPAWIAVGWLAAFSTAIGFLAFLRGLAVLGPVRSAIVATLEPFVTATLGALLLGQPLTLGVLLGGMFVAAAVLLLQRAQRVPAAPYHP